MIKRIEIKMINASNEMDFESAAVYRDQLMALRSIYEKQKVVTTEEIDQDVIAIKKDEGESYIEVFFIRKGKLLQRENFTIKTEGEESIGAILSSFLKQFYSEAIVIPKEVLVQERIDDQRIIEEWLTTKRGTKVTIKVPQKGHKKSLLDMVEKNAEIRMKQVEEIKRKEKDNFDTITRQLQHVLGLDLIPERIEAFDISNIQGVESVGSMVVFEGGKPSKKNYRRFKIKTVTGPNDYASMEEIILRRFKRGLAETKDIINESIDLNQGKFAVFPDLIMVDGGMGQISSAQKSLSILNLDIPICGMVKDDKHRTRGLIYKGEEIYLEKGSPLLNFITRIQDEAHRFAINYHRSLRDDKSIYSILEEITGVGDKRRKALLRHFKDLRIIKEATVDELMEVSEINKAVAESIYNYFRERK